MSASDLTVVVMTRDRVDLLEKALSSVFDRQFNPPTSHGVGQLNP